MGKIMGQSRDFAIASSVAAVVLDHEYPRFFFIRKRFTHGVLQLRRVAGHGGAIGSGFSYCGTDKTRIPSGGAPRPGWDRPVVCRWSRVSYLAFLPDAG